MIFSRLKEDIACVVDAGINCAETPISTLDVKLKTAM